MQTSSQLSAFFFFKYIVTDLTKLPSHTLYSTFIFDFIHTLYSTFIFVFIHTLYSTFIFDFPAQWSRIPWHIRKCDQIRLSDFDSAVWPVLHDAGVPTCTTAKAGKAGGMRRCLLWLALLLTNADTDKVLGLTSICIGCASLVFIMHDVTRFSEFFHHL